MRFAIFFFHVPSATTGAAYHVTSRGNARQDIVAGDQDCTLMRVSGLPTSSIDSVGVATPHHDQRLFSWHGRVP
ncbi:MAG: hypothetical protein KF876_17120 [Nitrospira sp.]|nr:hypothetical protein [Nitrospira sp.]